MKHVVFIGSHDKTDMMFYLSKLISFENRVLLVDVSKKNRYKFAYPKVEMNVSLHQHDQFDVLENVSSFQDIQKYSQGEYDFILVDIDDPEYVEKWPEADHYFLVTSYENPTIETNLLLMECFFSEREISELIPITKIIYEVNGTLNEDYLNESMETYPVDWKESLKYYPDERDMALKINNQFSGRIIFKGMSGSYKTVLKSLLMSILEIDTTSIKHLWKKAERGK